MDKISISRRAVLSGLAAAPLGALPAMASPLDAQARLDHHLAGLKQAVQDLSPTIVHFSAGRYDDGTFYGLYCAHGSKPK